jgi:hypothetical protein
LGFGFFGWDDYGGGYFVLVFEVEELDALGAAAGGADGFGVDADDRTNSTDDHELTDVPYGAHQTWNRPPRAVGGWLMVTVCQFVPLT